MLRSRLRNKFLTTKTEESKQLYNKQRNLCVTLLRKTKRNYFSELDNRILEDNKNFWKTVNPLFSEKPYQRKSIIIISKDMEEAIGKQTCPLIQVLRGIETFKYQPSILKIK